MDEAGLKKLVDGILQNGNSQKPEISPLGATILAALYARLAEDSRSVSKNLDIAHALVIRECVVLADDLGLIALDGQNERSQRIHYSLTSKGQALVEPVC